MQGCMLCWPRLAALQVNTMASNPDSLLLRCKTFNLRHACRSQDSLKVHSHIQKRKHVVVTGLVHLKHNSIRLLLRVCLKWCWSPPRTGLNYCMEIFTLSSANHVTTLSNCRQSSARDCVYAFPAAHALGLQLDLLSAMLTRSTCMLADRKSSWKHLRTADQKTESVHMLNHQHMCAACNLICCQQCWSWNSYATNQYWVSFEQSGCNLSTCVCVCSRCCMASCISVHQHLDAR